MCAARRLSARNSCSRRGASSERSSDWAPPVVTRAGIKGGKLRDRWCAEQHSVRWRCLHVAVPSTATPGSGGKAHLPHWRPAPPAAAAPAGPSVPPPPRGTAAGDTIGKCTMSGGHNASKPDRYAAATACHPMSYPTASPPTPRPLQHPPTCAARLASRSRQYCRTCWSLCRRPLSPCK